MKPRVFLTRRLPAENMSRLQAETVLSHGDLDRPLAAEELVNGVRDVDGLICLLTDRIDRAVMQENPQLKVVSNYAVGFNNIDVPAATELGIKVTNTPGVLTDCTADMAMSLLLCAARRVVEGDRLVRSGQWAGWGPLQLLGAEVSGATIGIVGMGRIGRAVAQRCQAFGMRILYWNRTRLSEEDEAKIGVDFRELERLWGECDFISVHVALCEATRHLVSAEAFRSMKSSAILINTARGPVVDEQALARALQSGEIMGAGLDVYENEPIVHPQLFELDNVVLAPHLGSATIQTRTRWVNWRSTIAWRSVAARIRLTRSTEKTTTTSGWIVEKVIIGLFGNFRTSGADCRAAFVDRGIADDYHSNSRLIDRHQLLELLVDRSR